VTQFHSEIRSRIEQARTSLGEASAARDDYLLEIRLGELETLVRLAAENGVAVEGIDETFAAHGRTTPPLGMARLVDVRALPRFAS
jgi:hypothetical protein